MAVHRLIRITVVVQIGGRVAASRLDAYSDCSAVPNGSATISQTDAPIAQAVAARSRYSRKLPHHPILVAPRWAKVPSCGYASRLTNPKHCGHSVEPARFSSKLPGQPSRATNDRPRPPSQSDAGGDACG